MSHPYRRRRLMGVVLAEGVVRGAASIGTAVAKAPASGPFASGSEFGGTTS